MHLRKANYFVIPTCVHALIAIIAKTFAVAYRACTLSLALYVLSWVILETPIPEGEAFTWYDLVATIIPIYLTCQNIATVIAIFIAIVLKWTIVGRRKVGTYNWDESPYCQQWNIYLASTYIIRGAYFGRGILEYLHGSAFLVWYFRALGARIGKDVCLYPTGADPMMTEPDLVYIGDEACIDRASIVAHINSAGNFQLNNVIVGARATLRTDCRLLSGATMSRNSTLLEHTLIMGGEVVDEGSTWQGWPGSMIVQMTLPKAARANHDVVMDVSEEDETCTTPLLAPAAQSALLGRLDTLPRVQWANSNSGSASEISSDGRRSIEAGEPMPVPPPVQSREGPPVQSLELSDEFGQPAQKRLGLLARLKEKKNRAAEREKSGKDKDGNDAL